MHSRPKNTPDDIWYEYQICNRLLPSYNGRDHQKRKLTDWMDGYKRRTFLLTILLSTLILDTCASSSGAFLISLWVPSYIFFYCRCSHYLRMKKQNCITLLAHPSTSFRSVSLSTVVSNSFFWKIFFFVPVCCFFK